MNKDLINFYTKRGKTSGGDAFEDIMRFDHVALEECHDFIQWLFPTITPSRFNPDAPLLDDPTIQALQTNTEFLNRFRSARRKLLYFWNIPYNSGIWSYNFSYQPIHGEREWTEEFNHNKLRISRYLESNRLLGYQSDALNFFERLLAYSTRNQKITATNLAYWYSSATGFALTN